MIQICTNIVMYNQFWRSHW